MSKVRFWDIETGMEVRRIPGQDFALVGGKPKLHKTDLLTINNLSDESVGMLLINELLPLDGEAGAKEIEAASFRAPRRLNSVR